MKEEYGPVQAKLARLAPRGLISYDLLWTLFKTDTQVTGTHEDSGLPVSTAAGIRFHFNSYDKTAWDDIENYW